MRYGFFGGAFNPPTSAHIELAKKAKEQLNLDKVFFVPVGNFYQKENLLDEKYRYEMLKLVCAEYEYLEVSDIELNTQKELKAIDVFKLITEKINNSAELYFIIGSDNLLKMENWKEAKSLIENYKYIVLERAEDNIQEFLENTDIFKRNINNFKIVKKADGQNISSTKVRNLLKFRNTEACNMIPEAIYEYIEENELYKK